MRNEDIPTSGVNHICRMEDNRKFGIVDGTKKREL